MAKFDSVQRRSSVEAVVEAIRTAIIHGEMSPGERITEMNLAAEINIGRSTVRTALLELEKDELVVRKPYSAWAVAELTSKDIEEIYSLRQVLEQLAIELMIENHDPAKVSKLKQAFSVLIDAEKGNADVDRPDADLSFHRTIVQLSGHTRLIKTYESLLQKVEWVYRWSERLHPRAIDLVEWHRPIYEALLAGDAKAAAAATKRNYSSASSSDIQTLKERLALEGA
jgi:DNA-binding GntR family transcriptional regulator